MIESGLKRIKYDARDRDFHKSFGAVSSIQLPPEFSVDAGYPMLDQLAYPYRGSVITLAFGCTGMTQGDLCQNQDRIDFDEKAIYDKTLEREGHAGDYTQGCDLRASLQVIVDYFGRGGYYNVQKTTSYFEGIRSAIWMNRSEWRAVTIGIPWFPELSNAGPDGIVPEVFDGDPMAQPWHNVSCPGWVIRNGKTYLAIKSWQGERVGDKGWLYFSPKAINYLLSIPYTGAFTVSKRDPKKVRVIEEQLNILSKIVQLISDWLRAKYGTMSRMNTHKKFGALSSSADPQKLSLTVESAAKVLIGLVGWYAARKGLDPVASTSYLQQIVDMTIVAIPAAYTVFNSLQGAWGLMRKLFAFFTNPDSDPLK